jgi:RHS repeat-associated protein
VLDESFTWNALGQLTSVTRNGITTSFTYDGFGRRVTKTSGSVATDYQWDADQVVAERDGAGAIVAEYAFYPGLDQPHSVTTSAGTFVMATETPGNVIGLMPQSANAVSAQYAYKPFGAMERNDQTVTNSLRFQSRPYDAETGLYYFRARYYDPELGRFISEDPFGLEAGVNAYAFEGNNPINRADPSGLEWRCAEFSDRTVCIWSDPIQYLETVEVKADPEGAGAGTNPAPRTTPSAGNSPAGTGGGAAGTRKAADSKPFITGECAIKATQFGVGLGLETVTLVEGYKAVGFLGKAVTKYAASWSPSIIREMGVTFGTIAQRRLATSAGASMILANPGLFGSDGMLSKWVSDINSPASEGPDLRDLIPYRSSVKRWNEAFAACQ